MAAPQGHPRDAIMCLFAYLLLSEVLLIAYGVCAITCGDKDKPLDPACVSRCFIRFLILESMLIALTLACIASTARRRAS